MKGNEPGVRSAAARAEDEEARQALRTVAEAGLRMLAEREADAGGIGGAGKVQRRSRGSPGETTIISGNKLRILGKYRIGGGVETKMGGLTKDSYI